MARNRPSGVQPSDRDGKSTSALPRADDRIARRLRRDDGTIAVRRSRADQDARVHHAHPGPLKSSSPPDAALRGYPHRPPAPGLAYKEKPRRAPRVARTHGPATSPRSSRTTTTGCRPASCARTRRPTRPRRHGASSWTRRGVAWSAGSRSDGVRQPERTLCRHLSAVAEVAGMTPELFAFASPGTTCTRGSLDPTFGEQFFDVAVGEAVRQIPTHREDDDLGREPEAMKRRRWYRNTVARAARHHPGTLTAHRDHAPRQQCPESDALRDGARGSASAG